LSAGSEGGVCWSMTDWGACAVLVLVFCRGVSLSRVSTRLGINVAAVGLLERIYWHGLHWDGALRLV
jgi:hypothetical protein